MDRVAVFFLREKKYQPPASTWGALAVASVAGAAYGTWAEYCAEHNGSCELAISSRDDCELTQPTPQSPIPS